jgi:putative membrane protein
MIEIIIKVLVGLVAFIHCYILWFEMFSWEVRGKKVFTSFPDELFAQTKIMAANQGVYNGFLAAGLIWSFFIQNVEWSSNISLFFLSCVSIAGIYGALTVEKRIFFVQAAPAIIAILLILLNM